MGETIKMVPATSEDVAGLEFLVETCYRRDLSKTGWTSESDWFNGPRVTVSMLESDLVNPDVTIFKCDSVPGAEDCGKVACCVRTERHGDQLHLGMICVHPSIQNRGCGRKMLEHVENFAREVNCRVLKMDVIQQRTELWEWYLRRGFKKTGESGPMPEWEGNPSNHIIPLNLIMLEKEI